MKTLIPAQKQTVWGWPAVLNFSLGGAGTGLYLMGLLLGGGGALSLAVALGGPALAGLGLLALTSEAGRPLRGLNLFRHLRRSWMSREALAAAIFIPAAGLDWLAPHPAIRAVALLAAAALMISQGFILYRARGVTAWSVGLMPLLFITTGLAAGAGLTALLAAVGLAPSGRAVLVVGLLCGAANLGVWLAYLRLPGEDFQHATRVLRSRRPVAVVVGLGHLLPLTLLAFAFLLEGGALWAQGLAGAALVLGGTVPKVGILLKAGYLRPIRLGPAVLRAAPN